jgi:outer membrane protein TolC
MLLTLAATRWQQARANYLPQIQLSSGYTIDKPYNPTQPSLGAYRGGITLGQELLSFGRQEAELRQAQAEHAATAAQLQAAINTAAYAAHAVYFDLLAAEDALLITEEKVRAFAVHLEQVRVMAELGTRIRYDITKAEVDLGTSRLECLQASNTLHLTRAALGRVLGLTEELPSLRLMWPAAPAVPTEAMPTLFQYARLRHPELIALQALVEAASAAVDWAVADLRPDLSLRASTSGAGHAFPLGWNWSLGPSIAWDAFTGWRKTSALQGATASLQACRSRLTSREQQLFQDLISARIQWQTALAQTMVAESVVQAARESLELVNARYALGLATAVELTDAEVAVAQARTQQVLARRNGLTAWALLCLHTGGSAQREGASL